MDTSSFSRVTSTRRSSTISGVGADTLGGPPCLPTLLSLPGGRGEHHAKSLHEDFAEEEAFCFRSATDAAVGVVTRAYGPWSEAVCVAREGRSAESAAV